MSVKRENPILWVKFSEYKNEIQVQRKEAGHKAMHKGEELAC